MEIDEKINDNIIIKTVKMFVFRNPHLGEMHRSVARQCPSHNLFCISERCNPAFISQKEGCISPRCRNAVWGYRFLPSDASLRDA